MSANFEGPKLKLNRAKQHVEQLDKLIGHYVAGEPYVLTQKIDPETGLRVFGFEEKIPVPTGITLLFGDAIHNLRTVLDMLVFEVTVANGGNRSYTGFPFHEERRGVETALQKGEMRFAPAPIKTFILEGVKPYKAGDYGLWAMNKLDNIDKHRLPLAITGIVGVRGDFVIGTQMMYNCTMGLTFGKNVMFVLSDDKVEFKNKPKFVVQVQVGEVDFLYREPLIPQLLKFHMTINNIIQEFELLVFGKHPAS